MIENSWISFMLGLAWMIAVVLGFAIFAMANHIGSKYVFTAVGVSRTGPKIGRKVPNISFSNNGEVYFLRKIVGDGEYPKLVLFLPHIMDGFESLFTDLSHLVTVSNADFHFLLFTVSKTNQLSNISSYPNVKIFTLDAVPHPLAQKLGIRVAPFAFLVDTDNTVVAKGLVNNMPHLCLLIRQSSHKNQASIPKDVRSICLFQ